MTISNQITPQSFGIELNAVMARAGLYMMPAVLGVHPEAPALTYLPPMDAGQVPAEPLIYLPLKFGRRPESLADPRTFIRPVVSLSVAAAKFANDHRNRHDFSSQETWVAADRILARGVEYASGLVSAFPEMEGPQYRKVFTHDNVTRYLALGTSDFATEYPDTQELANEATIRVAKIIQKLGAGASDEAIKREIKSVADLMVPSIRRAEPGELTRRSFIEALMYMNLNDTHALELAKIGLLELSEGPNKASGVRGMVCELLADIQRRLDSGETSGETVFDEEGSVAEFLAEAGLSWYLSMKHDKSMPTDYRFLAAKFGLWNHPDKQHMLGLLTLSQSYYRDTAKWEEAAKDLVRMALLAWERDGPEKADWKWLSRTLDKSRSLFGQDGGGQINRGDLKRLAVAAKRLAE